ncbi:MAG TPA: GNAT family N-acetyltransferase [Micromonosporaceae bacterium]|nr:GNAT family N-acetyltransferase [Micromonosporaceae bacterium]
MTLSIEPLDSARWPDLCTLFGPGGANSGCWCMWWRLRAKDWSAGAGAAAREPETGNKARFERIVASGERTGLLAYVDGAPAGWCAVAPREAYPRLLRSTTIAPTHPDEPGVWSVSCFFIGRKHRRAGLAHTLLDAAVGWAAEHGARVVEGYPVETGGVRSASGDYFTGTVGQFKRAGFAAQPNPNPGKRIVMRRAVVPADRTTSTPRS